MKAIFKFALGILSVVSFYASARTQPLNRASSLAVADAPISGSFHYSSNRTLYSCDFVDWRVQTILNDLGVENYSSNCSGGLEMRSPFINVTYRFFLPLASELPHGRLIRFNEYSFNDTWGGEGVGCDVTINFFRQLLRSIPAESNPYTIIQMSDFCWGSRGSFNIELEVK
ncbi:MAG: hypothetical protein QE271_08035 [Bacteriovoracaceae bacterium]|nr:hypothetical protein [Bacteriovoracaceae bacterium]